MPATIGRKKVSIYVFKKKVIKPAPNFSEQINVLKNKIEAADAVVIGAGAGLSTSAKKGCFIRRGIMACSNAPSLVVRKPLKTKIRYRK